MGAATAAPFFRAASNVRVGTLAQREFLDLAGRGLGRGAWRGQGRGSDSPSLMQRDALTI